MNLLQALEQKSTISNSKGGKYYASTFDANLDLFCAVSRFTAGNKVETIFKAAYKEDRNLALCNLLYLLDIREGKGERRLFKIIFKSLIEMSQEDAIMILNLIGKLGRFDYILEGLHTCIEDEVVLLIKSQLEEDLMKENPSLLAKWLPSHRTHNKTNLEAKYLMSKLNFEEREYRKILAKLRQKLNILERNLSNKTYENIDFEQVPTKAMLKYDEAFKRNMYHEYSDYKINLRNNKSKINVNGLFCYEIVKKAYLGYDETILNSMWNNQKQISSNNQNVLVVADTSGSMTHPDMIPLASAVGLAIYTAERNNGLFKNKFITFSNQPKLQEIIGENIVDKINNIDSIIANTDIDKVFKLILDSAYEFKLNNEDLPSHILIISDMEFDQGVYSKNGTNFTGWKNKFKEEGYKLPKIIFWNVAGNINGIPVTKNDNDCVMISGFSVNLLENIFSLEQYNPIQIMIETLAKYDKYL